MVIKKETYISVGLFLMLLLGGAGLYQKGNNLEKMMYQTVLPGSEKSQCYRVIGKYICYGLTSFIPGDSKSGFFAALPALKEKGPFKIAYTELSGYFNQDESSHHQVEKDNPFDKTSAKEKSSPQAKIDEETFKDRYYVMKQFITGNASLEMDLDMLEEWDFYKLIKKPLTIKKGDGRPQILIFHTHARETYKNGGSVVEVGEALKKELEEKYGIKVLHITDEFYKDNSLNVTGAYEIMEKKIMKVLSENPSIEVCIDLHRDGLDDSIHLVTDVDGKQTAKIMFVNGLCMNRNREGQIVHKKDLVNPYLEDNLAFSMQMQKAAYEQYPGLARKIYCTEWRFSTHMRPRSLLIEVGAQTNTKEEVLNAVEPIADILTKVLQKD